LKAFPQTIPVKSGIHVLPPDTDSMDEQLLHPLPLKKGEIERDFTLIPPSLAHITLQVYNTGKL
jgi:hypothetical protein